MSHCRLGGQFFHQPSIMIFLWLFLRGRY